MKSSEREAMKRAQCETGKALDDSSERGERRHIHSLLHAYPNEGGNTTVLKKEGETHVDGVQERKK